MRTRHLPMSFAEFELLPHHPGWKHEYWNGAAHLRPNHLVATVRVPVGNRAVQSPLHLRQAVPEDARALVSAFLRAFADASEYCDWTPRQVAEAGHECIETYFAGKRGPPHPASRVAMDFGA